MNEERFKTMKQQGIQLMVKGYAWAEAILQVLRESEGWDPSPYQWAAAGYNGAIGTGKTICGVLFGGTAFLGYLHGENATQAPDVKDEHRLQAIEAVQALFQGFLENFGQTDCQTLTGCDWSKKEDRHRYFEEKIYEDTCFNYFEYALKHCLGKIASLKPKNA